MVVLRRRVCEVEVDGDGGCSGGRGEAVDDADDDAQGAGRTEVPAESLSKAILPLLLLLPLPLLRCCFVSEGRPSSSSQSSLRGWFAVARRDDDDDGKGGTGCGCCCSDEEVSAEVQGEPVA